MEKYEGFESGFQPPENPPEPRGMKKTIAHDGWTDILPFLHDVSMAACDGRLIQVWYNSTSAEICGSSLIRGRYSDDGGKTWSEPFRVVGEMGQAERHYVPADLLVHEKQVYALITTMSGKNMTVDLQLFKMREDPMEPWEPMGKISEGVICNTTPQRMDNGSYIVGAWMPKKNQDPAFPVVLISQGGDICKPWRCVFLFDPLHPNAPTIRCPEISVSVQGKRATAYIRNDEGPSYVVHSQDCGETWSALMENTMNIGNSKMFAGNLVDGRPFLIYNQNRGYFVRTLLVLAVGDQKTGRFSRVYKIFEGHDEQLKRGRIWFYPCACQQNGHLYIGATLQETNDMRSVALADIPIENL